MIQSRGTGQRRLVRLAVLLALVLVAGGCGSSGGSQTSASSSASASSSSNASAGTSSNASSVSWKKVTIDVGNGQKITVQGPPHIAYFMAGSNVPYLDSRKKGIEAAVAKIPGASVASFDPQFNVQTQLNQIQNAITSGHYNAFIVDATDGNLLCKTLTQQAAAANIAVVDVAGPLCGLTSKPSSLDHWAPGTVAIVDNHSIDGTVAYLNWIIKQNPGPQKVVVLTGPVLHPLAPVINAALKVIEAKYPNFHVVAEGPTDFSVAQGYSEALQLLTAHRDATLLYPAFSDITQGAIRAVTQLGLSGKIKVYDGFGATAPILAAIKSGAVDATTPLYPISCGMQAVKEIAEAFQGHQGPRVILNDGGPVPAGSANPLVVIDKSKVSSYTPEG